MSAATRRGFIGGALASAALPAVAGAAEAEPGTTLEPARREIVRRGRAIAISPGGRRLVVAHDQRRTIAIVAPDGSGARIVDVGGQPLDVAISPDGRIAAVTTAFWDEPGLAIVDLRAAAVRARVDVGPAPGAVAYAGDRIVVTGGEQGGTVHVLDAERFAVLAERPVGTVPRGVAADPGGEAAWIAVSGLDQVVRVDLETGRIRRALDTPRLPDRVAPSPDGRRLLVAHGGLDAEHVSELDVASRRVTVHRAGRLPSAVGWTARGGRVVTLGGAGEIVVLRTGRPPRRHPVGGAPRGLAVRRNRAFTVDSLTGAVAGVRV